MRRLKYYLLGVPIMVLLFSFNVNAATTIVSTQSSTTSGQTFTFNVESYTGIYPEEVYIDDNYTEVHGTYKISLTPYINYLNSAYFYNGIVTLRINLSPTVLEGTLTYTGAEFENPGYNDGLRVYMGSQGSTIILQVVMDNHKATYGNTSLGTLTLTYTYAALNPNTSGYAANFTTSLTTTGQFTQSEVVQNNALTAQLYTSITQATGQELANIISALQAIQNQDYVYYAQLVSGINQLHTDNNTLHNDLTNILNEIDLDFAAVQTVLDLFPSYRTQVLQYWQELLQMNAAQSSAAAEIESQYADRESQSSQLINGMGSVVMPSISSNDLDILGTVDTTQKANFFGIIALITHNELITKIMLIIVLGAIVGYILYGKK